VAVIFGLIGSGVHSAVAQHNVRCDAPSEIVQPTVASVKRAQAERADRTPSDIRADEAIERSEKELRDKLIICRGC
jgi:hypothetical protein